MMFILVFAISGLLLTSFYTIIDMYGKLSREFPEFKKVIEAGFLEMWIWLWAFFGISTGLFFHILKKPMVGYVVLSVGILATGFGIMLNRRNVRKYGTCLLNAFPSSKRVMKRLLFLPPILSGVVLVIVIATILAGTIVPSLYGSLLPTVLLFALIFIVPFAIMYGGCWGALSYIRDMIVTKRSQEALLKSLRILPHIITPEAKKQIKLALTFAFLLPATSLFINPIAPVTAEPTESSFCLLILGILLWLPQVIFYIIL